MAELCARAVMESGNTAKTDQFWIDAEAAYLAAIFAHTSTLASPTPLTAYRLFTRQKPEGLLEQLLESPSETAREQAIIFSQTDPRLKGSIRIVFLLRVAVKGACSSIRPHLAA